MYGLIFPPVVRQPLVSNGLFNVEISRSICDTVHTVGLFWTSDQSDAETSTWQHTTLTTDRQTDIHLAEFEPTIPASERPQTTP